MQIKLYRSATVGIISGDLKVLVDPWLTDGEYYGSWSHFPYFDLDKKIEEINSYDLIYISHINPDHCSKKTLEKINKNIPVYIHKFHEKFLKFNLESLGFKVIELEHGKRTKIKNNFHINIFAADNCDPTLCYKFSGCANLESLNGSQQIDSLSVIDDGKTVILNTNDAPFELAKSNFNRILKEYGKIDALLTGYCGAGPYPQCIENFDLKQKIYEGQKKNDYFLNQAFQFINQIKPKYYMPFAGTYYLSGHLSNLNSLRGVSTIDQAYKKIGDLISQNKNLKTMPIKINLEDEFDLTSGKSKSVYQMLNENKINEYISNVLSKKKLEYENDEQCKFDEIYELSKRALERYLQRKLINNVKTKTNIILDVGDNAIKIDNIKNQLSVINSKDIKKQEQFVKYKVNINLLKKLLMGPKYAHWNNAETGSHIKFFRNPNIFERKIYDSMSYFHC